MDFNYTPEQEGYRNQVRAWLEANQPPPLTEEEKERADERIRVAVRLGKRLAHCTAPEFPRFDHVEINQGSDPRAKER